MKSYIILALIFLVTSIRAQDSLHYMSGPHGGLLKTVEEYNIETINTYGCITAYVFDKSFTIIPNKFISGSILFFYNNGATLNNYLIPSGTDGFTADVPSINYYYYTIHFKVNGKVISARVDNYLGIAEKEQETNIDNK